MNILKKKKEISLVVLFYHSSSSKSRCRRSQSMAPLDWESTLYRISEFMRFSFLDLVCTLNSLQNVDEIDVGGTSACPEK